MSNQTPPPPPPGGVPGPGGYPGGPVFDPRAAAAYAKAQRPWYKKKRIMIPLVLVVLVVIGAAAGGGSEDTDKKEDDTSKSTSSESPKGDKPADDKGSEEAKPSKKAEPSNEAKPSKEPAPKPKKEFDVKTNAATMLKEFEDNELGADAKYKGKVISVTGTIAKIDTEMFDDQDYVLKLNGGGEYEILTVDCFDIPNDDLAKLSVGQRVTMVGDFKDGGDLGVEMNHCKLA